MTGNEACTGAKFPDGTRCGEYGWHASDCPTRGREPKWADLWASAPDFTIADDDECDHQATIDELRCLLAASEIRLRAARLALAACADVREARKQGDQ